MPWLKSALSRIKQLTHIVVSALCILIAFHSMQAAMLHQSQFIVHCTIVSNNRTELEVRALLLHETHMESFTVIESPGEANCERATATGIYHKRSRTTYCCTPMHDYNRTVALRTCFEARTRQRQTPARACVHEASRSRPRDEQPCARCTCLPCSINADSRANLVCTAEFEHSCTHAFRMLKRPRQ